MTTRLSPGPEPTTTRTSSEIVGRWQAIDPGPLATRGEPRAIWTGSEVIVVGGLIIDQYQALADGAAFNPRTAQWRRIKARPVAGRVMGAVWTGAEMVTFGTEGISLENYSNVWSYDPARDNWRQLPLPPSTKVAHGVFWTGSRVLVWQPMETSPGATFDPSAESWTPLPANTVPGAIAQGAAVWADNELAVLGSITPEKGGPAEPRIFLFDPAAGSWRASEALPGPLGMWPFLSPVWTGKEVVVGSGGGPGPTATYAYEPAGDRWRTIENPDMSVAPAYFRAVRIADGRTVVRVGNPASPLQILDPETGHWSQSGPPPGPVPSPDAALVSTGDAVFHWGLAVDAGFTVQARSPNAAWLWTP